MLPARARRHGLGPVAPSGRAAGALVTEATLCQQQIADLLGCCWPAALSAAAKPLESKTWLACLAAVVDAGADLAALAADGVAAFTAGAHSPRPLRRPHR